MEKIHGNTHVFVLSCKFLTCKHKNMRVSMYFLHLDLIFTPHYIITDKGLLTLLVTICGTPHIVSTVFNSELWNFGLFDAKPTKVSVLCCITIMFISVINKYLCLHVPKLCT